MAKKGGKLLGLIAIGAAAAGAYYYSQKKKETPKDMGDEDIDNFDQDLDDGPTPAPEVKRTYTSLDFNTVEKKVKDTVVKLADTADRTASLVSDKLSGCATKIEEFFDDKKAEEDLVVNVDSVEASEDDYEEETIEE